MLLPFSSVCQTSGYDPRDAISVCMHDNDDDQRLDRANADPSGIAIIAAGIDAGQNVALEDHTGFFERDPVLDLVGGILRGVPLVAHSAL